MVQNHYWNQEIKDLLKVNPVSVNSKLKYLNPFINEKGVIRVEGRLNNSTSLNIFQKHPMVIPSTSYLATLSFRHEHIRLLHAGPQTILSSIRELYSPINGRNLAKKKLFINASYVFDINLQ